MKVTLYKNVIGEGRPSMDLYVDELLGHLPQNVDAFTIKAKKLPLLKHYLHKEVLYPIISARHQGDVNHISDHSYAGLMRFLDHSKTIITCHDLIPLDHAEEVSFFGIQRYWHNVKYLPFSARIIAISEWTKKCIIKRFNYGPEKIQVIYFGVSNKFRILNNKEFLKRKYNISQKVILHVGTSFPRKNVEFILHVLKKTENTIFVKIGTFTKEQKNYINRAGLAGRIREFSSIDQNILVEMYNMADVLLMPSHAEGFGLPIIEAMACGCAVICSDIEVFDELYSGAALIINVNNVDDAINKVQRLIGSEEEHNYWVQKGLLRARHFTWDECARKTYRIYKELYEE